jgi:glycopeptide antibiotics resistance protein
MKNQVPLLHFKKWWLGIGWFLVIVVIALSLMPPTPTGDSLFEIPYADKIVHFFTYFILMGWFAQIYHVPSIRWRLAISWLFLGIGLEILQSMSGVRHGDVTDIIANSLGILLSWLLASKTHFAYLLVELERIWKSKSSNNQ